MRKFVLLHGLGLVVACSPSPTLVTTEGSTTESSTAGTATAPTSADSTADSSMPTTGPVCPPVPPDGGGYDVCPGLCGGGGQCFNEVGEYAVCTRGCFMDCDCWEAPGGDAPVRCDHQLLENTSLCVLDCSGGQSCPAGMFCVAELEICAHPYPEDGESTSGSSGMDSSDSGTTDTGTTGTTDTGTTDTGTTDTGTTDTGTTDTGTTDTGTTDTGTTDTGTSSGGMSSSGSTSGVSTT